MPILIYYSHSKIHQIHHNPYNDTYKPYRIKLITNDPYNTISIHKIYLSSYNYSTDVS